MNKDALLATLIGFGIGLVITGLIILGPSAWNALPKPHIDFSQLFPKKPASETSTTTTEKRGFFLDINSPIPDSIESENELLVSGNTTAQALIVIQGNVDDEVVQTNEDGAFAGKIKLVEGQNDITVTSYLSDKQEQKTTTVFYTPEPL